MNSHPPPRYTSRGGYHEGGYDDSTIFPMSQDTTSQQQEHDHYHYHQEQQYMLDKLSQEAQLQQKIAEGMLTPRANNNNNTMAMDDDEVLFGMDDVPLTFMNPKPWESTNSNYHDGGQYGGGAQFPAMGPFPTNDVMNDTIDMPNEQPPAAVATAVATTTHHPTNNNNNNNGGPSSTKSVTFKTHDEFHSWDEQLDQLLHVDEEFFNVAHYLLEVVNVGSVGIFDEDDDENVGHYFDNGGAAAVALTPVNDGIDCNSGGILARFFTFAQCGTVQDVDYNEYGRQDGPSSHHMNNNNNNSLGGGEKKKYKLTKKLVQDFEQALKFRMENIDSNESLIVGGGIESEVVTRTKQIADKVEAYGLPGMPPSQDRIPVQQQQQPYEERYGSEHHAANRSAAYGDCYEVDCDEVEEEFMRALQASKMERRKQPRHFPILPTDDDEDVKGRGGMNEDERRFYNTFGNISTTFKESTQRQQRNCNSQSPFKSVCKLFSTLVGPKTSTPSKEECQIRLQQIQREISNADRMMESSTSKEVIAACANRIKKLRDEERMYQIFKEISKIQAMMQATESGSVKNACGQRLYQLSAELNSIDLGQYDDELDVTDEDDVEVDITVPVAKAPVAKAIGGDDLDWYERAQRYVRTQEPQDPVRSSNQHTIAANGHYRPPHMQQYPQQYSHQYPPHPSYIPDDENYYDRHYPAKQQFASPSPPRRVLSPRNGRPFPYPPY